MFIVFNLAHLSVIIMSLTDLLFLLAYFLKSLSSKILFIVFTISKKPILPFRNKSTRTSFAAFIIIGVESPNLKDLSISLIEGKILCAHDSADATKTFLTTLRKGIPSL